MKKGKLETPAWIKEGYDSPADYAKAMGKTEKSEKKKGKTFKIRKCPECGSYDVRIVLSNLDSEEETSTGKQWECLKCKWKGPDIEIEEVDEDGFMKYLDDKGEEVA